MTYQERTEWKAKLSKLDAEIAALNDKRAKMETKTRWYPLAFASGATFTIVVTANLFL